MKVLVHDLSNEQFQALFPNVPKDIEIVSDNGKIKNCIGCFSCWVKTPGVCVLKDGYENMGKLLSQAEELIIISECFWGTYSPFVRNVWDRSLPHLLPFFEQRNGETHHKARYQNKLKISAYFYGADITPQEKECAEQLVHANGVNFHAKECVVSFVSSFDCLAKEVSLS